MLDPADASDVGAFLDSYPREWGLAMKIDRRSFTAGLLGSALCGPTAASTSDIVARHAPRGRFGFVLIDADTGSTIDAMNADDLFVPASLAKIPTSFVSMITHGPSARFSTDVRATGQISSGILYGDLTLIGGGDPSLDTADLAMLADRIVAAGITRITGSFRYYEDALPKSEWLDPQQPWQAAYNPSISGLNLNYNRVQFKWSHLNGALAVRGAAVSDGKVAPAPSVKFRIVGGDQTFSHNTLEGGEIWSIPQAILQRSGRRWLPVRRPGLFSAGVLKALCAERGIELPMPVATSAIPDGMDVARHSSAPVSEMLQGMLRFSTNLTAEALGAAAGYRTGHRPIDMADAGRLTTDFIRNEIGGTGWGGFSLANHSGLTVHSKASPRQIAEILRAGRSRYGQDFVTLFNEKTLGQMPSGGLAPYHKIRSKTGTMHYIRGLAGYLTIGSRDTIFAFMAMDDANRNALDAMFTPYADNAPADARQWLRHARTLEGTMIADWLMRYSS